LKLVASQNNNTMRSQAWNRSVAVVEAGIEEALMHLNKNGAPDGSGTFNGGNLSTDGWNSSGGSGWWKSNSLGDDYYIVSISSFNPPADFPKIVSQGYVKQVPTFAGLKKFGPFMAELGLVSSGGTVKRSVLCTTTNVPTFTKALVAKDTIDLSGQNVFTDSFDSGNPLYHTADSNGVPRYDFAKRRDNGDIATNRGVTNSDTSLNTGNAKIWGRVSTGPNTITPGYGLVNIGANGKIGDFAWHADTTKKGIKEGWSRDDMNVDFPEVKLPFEGGSDPANYKGYYNGVYYDTILTSGDWRLVGSKTLQGKVLVSGHARLIVQSGIDLKGIDDTIKILPGSSIKIYADCPSVNISGNGVQNPGLATNFFLFGTSKNTSLQYGGNSAFTGVFYAPNAAMSMGGGGNTTIDFSGAGIVGSVKMTGNYSFHYDENLKKIGTYRGYVLTSWNEM
jgi:hypothetical protein